MADGKFRKRTLEEENMKAKEGTKALFKFIKQVLKDSPHAAIAWFTGIINLDIDQSFPIRQRSGEEITLICSRPELMQEIAPLIEKVLKRNESYQITKSEVVL